MAQQSVTLLTLVSFLTPMLVPARAWADDGPADEMREVAPPQQAPKVASEAIPSSSAPVIDASAHDGDALQLPPAASTSHKPGSGETALDPATLTPSQLTPSVANPPAHTLDLPSGADKSGVSSQAIAMPQGAGKIQGMGESFSAQLSTGIGTYSVPFSLIGARGAVSPSLGLSYSSSGGHGLAGVGWDIGVPSISRQTDRGIPKYKDPANGQGWHPEQDTFVFNGGQELVPIGLVQGEGCVGANGQAVELPSSGDIHEKMPTWGTGWQYFRPRVEGSFLRFFWSPDHKTWRVQDKSGTTMELGVPLDANPGLPLSGELEVDPQHTTHIFRWNLSRQYDPQPNAVNHVVYRYKVIDGMSYLSDIFDTSPVSNPTTPALSEYAHHTRLVYENRPDPSDSFRRGWRVGSTQRLAGLDITSKTFAADGPRQMVRRYHLAYDGNSHPSLLKSVQLEGRCHPTGMTFSEAAEDNDFELEATACPMLPAVTFGYQHVEPHTIDGGTGTADLPGFEGFDERLHTMSQSPDHSMDEELTGLFDVNSDGLPDIVVTAPGLYNGKHGLYLNGTQGVGDKFQSCTMGVHGVLGADANVIKLSNDNLVPQDLDGDAKIDLLHMPKVKQYSVYTPTLLSGGTNGCPNWVWQGRTIDNASDQNVKIDFGSDAVRTHVMDVNADGLVDVVVSTGTEIQTYFSLGRYPHADGQFGHAIRTSATSAQVFNEAVTSCVPWSSTPVQFDDPDVKLGDMNGDGLVDIVRVREGDVRYWPGRGNGMWGTGDPTTCLGGSFGQNRHVAMDTSPHVATLDTPSLRLDDVNGDGLDDLVQVRFNAVDVWLNVDGKSWTDRHVIANTPASPGYSNRVRLVDMNGSGTRDVLFGNGLNYQYMDLTGGERPWVLTHVENGLGKTTDIEYTSSTEMMLAAAAAGKPWTSTAPSPLHVVQRVTDRDNLSVAGRPAGEYTTEYTYRDPVYDGPQREFRGFRDVQAKRLGDENSPTAISSSRFLLGECAGEGKGTCATEDRWEDNPNEALKGLPIVAETFDETGVYPNTTHHTYGLRRLYSGLDGRAVWYAYERGSDAWVYDTAPFAPETSTVQVDEIVREYDNLGTTQGVVTLRSSSGRVHTSGSVSIDVFGNMTSNTSRGCIEGCLQVDEGAVARSIPIPVDNPSRWIWRTGESYVVSANDAAESNKRKQSSISYDGLGNPIDSSVTLKFSLPLQRFHESMGAEIAADPPRAVSDGTILQSHVEYNDFGQSTSSWRAGNRCRFVMLDSHFSQLTLSESMRVGTLSSSVAIGGRECGDLALTSQADTYDRGLGIPLAAIGLHGERSEVQLDGFGRVVQMWAPHPSNVGSVSLHPSMKAEYLLTTDSIGHPYSVLHSSKFDAVTLEEGVPSDDGLYMEAWAYVDGMGRTLVTLGEADTLADGHGWVVNGLTEYDRKGTARRAYLPWYWDGDPTHFPLSEAPTTPYGRQRYDAFGRQIQTFALDGSVSLATRYHALSTDSYDASDLEPGPHQGTYVTARKDGFGRASATVERAHEGSAISTREIRTSYLFSGEVESISRVHVGSSDVPVTRWIRYDSLGRMVLNAEPHTTYHWTGIIPDANAALPSTDMRAWRYAYDDAGEVVGTSDARGCGVNYYYDTAGRLFGEDYSPCLNSQQIYSEPTLDGSGFGVGDNGTGVEVLYHFDTPDSETEEIETFEPSTNAVKRFVPASEVAQYTAFSPGRLISVSDRSSKVVTRFDGRGRTTGIAKKIAKPGTPASDPGARYAPRWYVQETAFDGADRPVSQATGATVAELMGTGSQSRVSTSYTARGTVKQVGGSYGTLVGSVTREADGLVGKIVYGDIANTTTGFTYDSRRRMRTVQTYRGPPASWTSPPLEYLPAPVYGAGATTFQLVLQDDELSYDGVDNPVEIHDWRNPAEWPASAKPVTQRMQYDDLNRVTKIDYQYQGGPDAWKSPFEQEDSGVGVDPRRAAPIPHVSFDNRVLSQSFAFDWLGNTTATDDDAHGFYDRSLGAITNSSAGLSNGKAYQLVTASESGTRGGALAAIYDVAGNLIDLSVSRSGGCLPTGATCSQRFIYNWDEVGRLVRARRWDTTEPSETELDTAGTPAADLQHAYDHGGNRVLKTAADAEGVQAHTVYIFGSLELRRTSFDTDDAPGDYDESNDTEIAYLFAHGVRLARLVYDDAGEPEVGGVKLHVLFELGDHLGSSRIVLDKASSELVEAGTYMGYGQPDSDYRPERWKGFREDYRFTGKEEDSEVGLTYFGKRFLSSALGRWASADPLVVQGLSSDLNAYAYVHGRILSATDPVGLADVKVDVNQASIDGASLGSFNKAGDLVASGAQGQGIRIENGDYNSARKKVDELAAKQYLPYALNESNNVDGKGAPELKWRHYTREINGEQRLFYTDATVGGSISVGSKGEAAVDRLLAMAYPDEKITMLNGSTHSHPPPAGEEGNYSSVSSAPGGKQALDGIYSAARTEYPGDLGSAHFTALEIVHYLVQAHIYGANKGSPNVPERPALLDEHNVHIVGSDLLYMTRTVRTSSAPASSFYYGIVGPQGTVRGWTPDVGQNGAAQYEQPSDRSDLSLGSFQSTDHNPFWNVGMIRMKEVP